METKNKLKIGIQGGIGSFNESAILQYLKSNNIENYEITYLYTTQKVLAALSEGSIDRGLFAVHNTLGGIVQESIEAMGQYSFEVADKVSIPIQHFLMVLSGSKAEELERVLAHPQVFAQCQKTMQTRHPGLPQQSGAGDLIDTARAAEALYKGEIPNHTAILGPKRLAELYSFEIIDQNLQDDATNVSTFLLVKNPDYQRLVISGILQYKGEKVSSGINAPLTCPDCGERFSEVTWTFQIVLGRTVMETIAPAHNGRHSQEECRRSGKTVRKNLGRIE